MTGLIAAALAPHTPRIGIEAKAPPFQLGLIEGLRALGRELAALRPDFFVMQSSHWVSTFNWYVTGHAVHEGMCVADEAPDLIPGVPYRRPGVPDFAAALRDDLLAAGIPCGFNDTPHFAWDYASYVPLHYLDAAEAIPVMLLPTVICSPLEENRRVGALVHETARRLKRRVVFIASSALSHEVARGPELWPTPERRALDQRFLDMAEAGKVAELAEWLPQFARDSVAEMGGRPVAALIGAAEQLVATYGCVTGRRYGTYAQSSGSGNAAFCFLPA